MAPKTRWIGLVGLCFATVLLVGVSLEGAGDRRTEALGAVDCLTPPCVVNGETVSPHISFHYSQQVQAFPHPLTQKAIDKAEEGDSLALDDEDLSVKHKGQISRVKRVTKRTEEESTAQLEKSRVALWKTVGELRARLADYRRRLVKAKANMMARDNFLSARVESLQTALGRAKVALTRRLGYIKVHSAVVSHMKGPAGKNGADGKPGARGPRGYRGAMGDRGPPGDKGKSGPPGWPGRDGAAGPIGPMGDMGLPGPRGFAGQNGPVGRSGPMGPVGKPGVGTPGTRGPTGPVGPPGPPGQMGKPGVPGLSIPGPSGRPGMPGNPGVPGAHGAHGPAGVPGTAGAPGFQ